MICKESSYKKKTTFFWLLSFILGLTLYILYVLKTLTNFLPEWVWQLENMLLKEGKLIPVMTLVLKDMLDYSGLFFFLDAAGSTHSLQITI